MALDCVYFCQRTTVKLKDKKEQISSKSLNYEQSGAFRCIYGEILNNAADITKGIRKRSTINTIRGSIEIRQLIQSMLENCSFELRLCETTQCLLQRDLNDDIQEMCTIINSSVPIRLNQYIDKNQQQKNKFVIFACRHVFHLRCFIEIQTEQSNNNFCLQCTTNQSSTTTSIVRPELRRLTAIHSDQNDKQISLNNIQQQVITAILDRKHDDGKIQTPIIQAYSPAASLQLPDKWQEYLSSSGYDDQAVIDGAAGGAGGGPLVLLPLADVFTDDSSSSSSSSPSSSFTTLSSSSSTTPTFSMPYILLSIVTCITIVGVYMLYVENNGHVEVGKINDRQAEEFKKQMQEKLQEKLEPMKENLERVLQAKVEGTKAPLEKDLANVQQNLAKLEEDRQVLQETIPQKLNTAEIGRQEQLDRLLIEILDRLIETLENIVKKSEAIRTVPKSDTISIEEIQ
ncbi:unnamed protein product [Rotaria sordida]|uniref:Uncharacterized protein n=1 Tax=Rotaria sordida TaxID=392033 RepID=A0A815NBI8_9BILA|nr:unnamed protein product [Rotaria sordida]